MTPGGTTPADYGPTGRTAQRGPRRSRQATRDLTRGGVAGNLWFLAWPQLTEAVLGVLDQIADLIWVGRLGFEAIAGLGVVQAYVMVMMTARTGLETATRAMISRAVGARRISVANQVLLQSLTVTAAFSILMITVGMTLAVPLLRVVGLSDGVVDQAVPYMRIQFLAMGVWSFHGVTGGALQASGDAMTPLKAETVGRVGHLVLSPLLIFGWLGLPAMGLAGAATASLLARSAGMGINLYGLTTGSSRLRLRLRDYRLDRSLVWRLAVVGAPASVTDMQRGLSRLILVAIAASFGAGAVAAFTVARRAEMAAMLAGRAMGRASGAIAGQSLGAGLPDRARSTVRWAIAYVAVVSVALTGGVLLFSEQVVSFINPDPEFVRMASQWLIVMAAGYFALSGAFVFVHALNTSGQTMVPMVVTMVFAWGVEIPMALALARLTPLEHLGIPSAIVVGATLRFSVLAWYFGRGRWLRTGMM